MPIAGRFRSGDSPWLKGLVALTMLLSTAAVLAVEPPLRKLQVEDVFRSERIGEVVLSPDGDTVAFVRYRPQQSPDGHVIGGERADVWMSPVEEGTPVNMTNGEQDGSSFWNPQWSPDGIHLAMLSTRGGGVRVWIWDRRSGTLRPLSTRAVSEPYAWVDNERLVVRFISAPRDSTLFPEDDDSHHATALRAMRSASMDQAPSVSVLDSGVGTLVPQPPQVEVALVDLQSTVSTVTTAPDNVYPAKLYVSPDRQHIAVLDMLGRPGPPRALPADDDWGWFVDVRLTVFNRNGTIEKTDVRLMDNRSFGWSEQGEFAFIAKPMDGIGLPQVYRGTPGEEIVVVSMANANVRRYLWMDRDRLLMLAEPRSTSGIASARTDWWLADDGNAPRKITSNLKTVPTDIRVVGTGQRYLVWASQGDVWRLDPNSGSLSNLTSHLTATIDAIAWPGNEADQERSSVIVESGKADSRYYYRVDTTTGEINPILHGGRTERLAAFSDKTGAAVFAPGGSRTSGSLFVANNGRHHSLLPVNGFLKNLVEADATRIQYRSLDGDLLTGWILLPVDYQRGKRYPLVIWVYAGQVFGEQRPDSTRIDFFHSIVRLQLLASRGYAVLLPSMPIHKKMEEGVAVADPYMELGKGVLPAIDKVIELGLADGTRLAVMGHSFGGYSTYGLVTQTTRFKAAVAMAGMADLISYYGTISMPVSYSPMPELTKWWQVEATQILMGNPPWRDAGRYIRNSPLFFADRVTTPVLIVQGDADHVSIAQGEEFFTALYRQGKRARFLRYWGEPHSVGRPANVRHVWRDIYAWLDEFCDVARDANGEPIFDGDRIRSRAGHRNDAPHRGG